MSEQPTDQAALASEKSEPWLRYAPIPRGRGTMVTEHGVRIASFDVRLTPGNSAEYFIEDDFVVSIQLSPNFEIVSGGKPTKYLSFSIYTHLYITINQAVVSPSRSYSCSAFSMRYFDGAFGPDGLYVITVECQAYVMFSTESGEAVWFGNLDIFMRPAMVEGEAK